MLRFNVWAVAILLSGLVLALDGPIRKPGYCSMYDNCGKKSVFGASLPCANNTKAPIPSKESQEILTRICGLEFPVHDGVCCSYGQLQALEQNLKKVEPLVSSCPACRKNFYDFFCKFTCLPDQSTFLEITETSTAVDTKLEIITELSVYTDPEYAAGFFDSCKNLKFSATNGFAMDLIGGGATNYSQFLKFLGDEKPLLGGSPFQINFKYHVPDDEHSLKLSGGSMKLCDDPQFRCACSDCPSSCPTLPPAHDFNKVCKIGIFPCFSFTIFILWIIIFLAIGGYHVQLARSRRSDYQRLNNVLNGDLPQDSGIDEEEEFIISSFVSPRKVDDSKLLAFLVSAREATLLAIEDFFGKLGLACASYPGITIGTSLVIVALCCTGLTHLQWETNPVNLWVSQDDPALKNLQYFESNFGEWFRVEQLIISNKNESQPVLSWDTIQWWFEKELELQLLEGPSGEKLDLDSFCFKPLGETCAIESFAQYFQGDIRYLSENNWAKEVSDCANSPVNCLPTFQQPLKKNILFSDDDVLNSRAFVITLLLNSKLNDANYTAKAVSYEHALQNWIQEIQKQQPHLNIAYSTEVSLEEELNQSTNTDVKVVIISYVVMFLYASLALGGKIPTSFQKRNLVLTRFQLGLSGILIILLAVVSSAGLFAYAGIKSTLIIAEVIPFLVLAIGVDNVFLIVHELHIVTEKVLSAEPIAERISASLSKIGPSCLLSAILQILMFLLATSVKMPAVRNFALYSAGAVTINFILQMTLFISILALDQKRLEEGRVDCAPWIHVGDLVELTGDEHVEYDFSLLIRNYYAPWLLKPSNKRKILTFFLAWLGLSLGLLPRIELGLDQRIALPSDSYLIDYFNSVYNYLNVGPPAFFVVKDLDVTERPKQQQICGKFSTCETFSLANILEQEFNRSAVSTIAEPASNWLDDFLTWLNPNLDQCCRFKKSAIGEEFCSPFAPPRQCVSCYADHSPAYNILMEGLPTGVEFMKYFRQWITEPSDPCPLGGKAPYSSSISYNLTNIKSSYLRTSHKPLRSQKDFIVAYKNSLRIVEEVKTHSSDDLDIFAFSPFYVFFVQYETILALTFSTLAIAGIIIWAVSALLLGLARSATIMCVTVASILANIGGVMAVWNISLNAVSLVNLIICLGLAVEFTVHITRAYLLVSLEKDVDDLYQSFMNLEGDSEYLTKDRRTLLASKALCKVGGPVLSGITITKLIGIAVLAFTRSQIFEVYYFRMWLSLVVIASTHALILLPILLSMFGDV